MNLEKKIEKIEDFEDRYNPLKFYAMLREIGVMKEEALRYSRIYEEGIYKNVMDIIEHIYL